MPGPPRISVTELAAGAADFPLLDEGGQPSAPLLAVDLSGGVAGGPDDEQSAVILRRAAARAASCPRLLVGLAAGPLTKAAGELLRALDLTLTPALTAPLTAPLTVPLIAAAEPGRESVPAQDPEQALAALDAAVAASPWAALVLRQVLRATEQLPVRAALDVGRACCCTRSATGPRCGCTGRVSGPGSSCPPSRAR